MSLDMLGFIDDCLESAMGTRYAQSGSRDGLGKWVGGAETPSEPRAINLQPLGDKELTNLGAGGERIQDFRKFYINDGSTQNFTPQDEWEFDATDVAGIRFTIYMMDNRPWRNYCKCVVARNDR